MSARLPEHPMTLIGLGFTARVGKSYAASLIKAAYPDRTVVVLAFADAVKEGLHPVLAGSGIDPFTEDPEQKKILRPLLVAHGEFWRAVDKDHWLDLVMEKVDQVRDLWWPDGRRPIVIIPDVRYQNEAQAILDRRGCVVHVKADVEPANDVERVNAAQCAGMASVEVFNDFGPGFGPRLLDALAPWLPPRSSEVAHSEPWLGKVLADAKEARAQRPEWARQPAISGVLPAKTPSKASEVAR